MTLSSPISNVKVDPKPVDLVERLSTLESNNNEYQGLIGRFESAMSRLDGGDQSEQAGKPTEVAQGALSRFDDALEMQQTLLGLLSNAVERLERII